MSHQPPYEQQHDYTQLRPGGQGHGSYGGPSQPPNPYDQYAQGQYGYAPPGPPVAPGEYPRDAQGNPISPWGRCAPYGKRVIAFLLDFLLQLPGTIIYTIGIVWYFVATFDAAVDGDVGDLTALGLSVGVMLLGFVIMMIVAIVNTYVRQGRTGQSWGKSKQGIRLVRERDGQPVGAGMAFVRYLLRGVICQAFYLDILWPLWDAKRQALSDKILGFLVVEGSDPR